MNRLNANCALSVSERESETELNVASPQRGGCSSELRARKIPLHAAEIRAIEQIEEFGPEIQLALFSNPVQRKMLHHVEIHVIVAGAIERVSAEAAVLA